MDIIGKICIVRTYSAGVHFGAVESQNGKEVTLVAARRIWSWRGANTLNEIALRGVGNGSRISEAVEAVVLTEAIEIIPCADAAIKSLSAAGWAK